MTEELLKFKGIFFIFGQKQKFVVPEFVTMFWDGGHPIVD